MPPASNRAKNRSPSSTSLVIFTAGELKFSVTSKKHSLGFKPPHQEDCLWMSKTRYWLWAFPQDQSRSGSVLNLLPDFLPRKNILDSGQQNELTQNLPRLVTAECLGLPSSRNSRWLRKITFLHRMRFLKMLVASGETPNRRSWSGALPSTFHSTTLQHLCKIANVQR